MQKFLIKAVRSLESLSEQVGRAAAWLTVFMVVVTFAVVLLRYVFDMGWIAMQESVTYMHAAVFMLGAAFTFKREGHVRVDVFYRNFGPRGRALVDIIGGLFLLIPIAAFIIWSSWNYVGDSWRVFEGSREAGGLPLVYWLKTLIPVMALLMLAQGVADIARNALLLAGVDLSVEEMRAEPVDEQGDAI